MAFLIDIGTAIVAKLAEYTIEPVIRQVGYVICYNKNLEKLQTRVCELGYAREGMEHVVETEERKGKKIETEVQNWLTKVDQLTKEADDLNDKHLAQTKCLHGFCPNLKLRHHLSRKSTKLVLEVAELLEKKKNPDQIAYVAKPEEMCLQDYEAFDSRTSSAMAVINELRNSNTYMIGVYGIGGVGKTTLVKEVNNQLAASDEKLFDEVVMIRDLKHDPSIERIQKEMAENLGLEPPENGTPAGRARLISNRIKDKKTLVILDDVWESINLEAVGLPRMATLKILLTSRTKEVLAKDMGTQKEFLLEVLNKEESWRLFQKMAGDIVENPDIQTIAAQVAENCGGLPLLIVTVARSLKDGTLHEWKDTLRRLKEFDGEELTNKTYAAIEWSYDKLKSDELKSVFLLCASEGGSDNSVDILSLLKYSMGLGFIKNADTLEKAWDALNSLLKKLQHSCLLLDIVQHGNYEWVRIHDLVKHVAKLIAARDHHVLSVSHESELKEWPDMEFREKCTRISLKNCRTPELPEVLECPELTMLVLFRADDDSSREIPSNFFKEMKKLKVLDLTKWSIASLPPSLKFLKDLQTLCLDQCTLEDIALVGELQNLKILSFLKSKFKELPEEIGQLTRLQLLDLTDCSQLEVISPDVISKLKRLEELRMGKNSFNKWEAGRVGETKRSNASLEELTCLPRLTALHIHIPDATILPADLFTTSELERFQICIGSVWKWDDVDEALNALKLKLTTNNELDQGLKMLLKKTQDLYVEGMEDVNDKFFRELATAGYQQLKHLHVQNIAKFAYTINEKVCFPNLTWLAVSELKSLRFLLSSSMARSLSQIKRLQISGCQFMEVVISIEESKKELAENFFPQLQDLELNGLPNLTKFCSSTCERLEDCTESAGICEEVEEIDSKRNLDFVIQHFLFENKDVFPNMKKLSLNGLAKLTTIWNNQVSLGSSKNLETIEIVSCDNLKSVFPTSVAKSLQQLSRLKVQNCGVEEIISKEDDVQTTPMFVFSKLTYVRFENLPQLKSFYPGLHSTKWPSLLTLAVYRCTKVQIFAKGIPELKNLCTPNEQFLFLLEKDSFPNLETLGFDITENWDSPPLHLLRNLKFLCSNAHTNSSLISLEQLFGLEKVNGEIQAAGDVTFPFLRELHLHGMRKLMNLGDDSFGLAGLYFPKVEILVLEDCDSLQNLRSSAISFNYLTTLQVIRCKGLKYLTSISMAKSLMQLKKLEVRDCEEMIEIVASSGNDVARNAIEFKMLKHLELSALPSLRGFCSGTHTVKFPSLENLMMSGCTQLEGFILDVTTDKNRLGNEIEDIESARLMQRFLFDNKVELPKLTRLTLKDLTKLATIWNKQIQDTSAPHQPSSFGCENLEYVEIDSCASLRNIFPSWVARNLQQLLPPSLKFLKDLQTLCLHQCTLEDIALVGELQNLKILSFLKSKFKELPEEIGQLTRLQLLDLTDCSQLEVISPDVISKLKRLEELRMGKNSFNKWEAGRVGETKRSNASLEELTDLPRLTALHIHIPDAAIIPANLFTTSKLDRFQICIGSVWKWDDVDEALNALKLKLTSYNELDQGLKMLLKKTQDLYVEGMEDVNDKFFRELATGGYQQLKHLHVQNIAKFAYTINEKVGFPNLTRLAVSELKSVRFLLSSSMARSLSKVKHLQIYGCQFMEVVISIEESNKELAENFFPQLQDLELNGLPNLTKFCSTCERLEDCTEKAGICEEVEEIDSKRNLDFVIQHFLFENKGEFPNMKKLSLNGLAKLTTIWNNQVSLGSSKDLEAIEIVSCDNLKSVFPASMAKSLQQLSCLMVQDCGVEEIISKEDDVQTTPIFVFSKLTYVRFANLPQLKSFYPRLHSTKWPSLLTLAVYRCTKVQIFAKGIPELKNPCTPNEQFLFLLEKDSFPNLEFLGFDIMENWDSPPLNLFRKLIYLYTRALTNSSLNSLEQLLGLEKVNGEIHAAGDATFPFLRDLRLYRMRKLMNLGDDSFGPAGLYFPKVEILKVEDCDSLQNLRSSAISFNYLTTLQVIRCKGLKYLTSISMAKSLMQLTKLEVRDCEEMIEIVASSGNDVARNEIEFKMLKHLELSALPSLRGFCSGTHTVKFPSLENLMMSGCTQLEGFILDVTTDKNRLGNEIEDIESATLMQRFLFDNKVELPKLTRLTLKGLTKLATIWNKQIQNTSAAPFDCENLEHVEIDSCDNLENIFPLWVARNLQQLQTLVVKNCGVKEIVAREERLQTVFKFVFPKVTRVLFGKLSQLVNFYPGMHVCSWPLLNDLGVYDCDKVDIFADEFSSFQEKLDGNNSSTLTNRQFLFSFEKDSFPNLERLDLNAMEFSNGPLPAAAQFFGKLKKLEVCCPESKSLVFLDKLLPDPEGSSTASAVGITTQQFPHLKELRLVGMKKLMHLGQDDEEDNSQSATRIPNIPNLQNLSAKGCHSLRNLGSSAISFDNLTTLQVTFCNGLEYLITYSMANSLTQLTTLEVEGCQRLLQIVGSNEDHDSRNELTFRSLKHLKLSVLPRLQSFCSGNCLAKLPSLETSTMSNRLKLKIFAADNQTLQLITNEGDDTDVDDSVARYPAEERG